MRGMKKIKLRSREYAILDMAIITMRDLIQSGEDDESLALALYAMQNLMPIFELDSRELPTAQL